VVPREDARIRLAWPDVGADELAEVAAVLESGMLTMGPKVVELEAELARACEVEHAVAVSSGTAALHAAVHALGIGPGDEVLVPAYTFPATANVVALVGAKPVLVDVDPETMNIDPAQVEPGERTKAIVAVHLFGRPAPLEALAALDVPIIEDAAQAFGSPDIAGVGVASTFSFYPTKNLFALGDGGLVGLNDPELAERIRMLRFHGSKSKRIFEYVGTNSRLDEIQAAVLRIFLRQLDDWTSARRDAAERYRRLGLGEACDVPADESGHVYHLFVSRSPQADALRAAMTAAEIGNAQYYIPPLHLQPALRYLGYSEGDLPETERASRENFSVPLWAGIDEEQQEQVVATVLAAAGVAA